MRGLPTVSGQEVVRALERAGFAVVSQRGSYVKLRGMWARRMRTVIVPLHREVAAGTLRSVLRQAGLTPEEFSNLFEQG